MRSGRQEYDVMCLVSNYLLTASSKFKTHVINTTLAPIPQSLFGEMIPTTKCLGREKVVLTLGVGPSYSCLPLLIQF